VVNLALSILLVHSLGIEGVAWGTTIPNLISNLAVAVYVCRTLDVRFATYLRSAFLAPVVVAAPLAAGWWAAVSCLDLNSWLPFIGVGTAGVMIYLAAAALMEFGARSLWQQIGASLPRRPQTRILPPVTVSAGHEARGA
jgi:O-antigen/teichoic acid export membrane protein